MKTVYKYIIPCGDHDVEMPQYAEILAVATQGDDLCLWAKVNTHNKTVVRHFQVFGTGHPISEDNLIYHGTGFFDNGLVFHVMEGKDERDT